jgi:hypothetical protein
MKIDLRRFGAGLAALLLAGALLGGCDETSEDNSEGVNPALVGIWQNTEISGGDTLAQHTTQLFANGHMAQTIADYQDELCTGINGLWSATDDSLATSYSTPLGTEGDTLAFALSGNTLTVTLGNGTPVVYTKVLTLPDCEDYGFPPPAGWTGTLSAVVDGTSIDFSAGTHAQFSGGEMGFGGSDSLHSIGVLIDSDQAGSYGVGHAVGTYIPDLVNLDLFTSSTAIQVDLSVCTPTHVAGTFSFTGINASMQTVTIASGVVDITHP